jgi:hypothetical protein
MPALTILFALLVFLTPSNRHIVQSSRSGSQNSAARQLLAVRGEVTKVASQTGGSLLITIRPAKEFGEVTVAARENDLVGQAIGRSGDNDLIGLLAGDNREDETITAAELEEGDVVSVIYDPQQQNKALEIYIH